MNDLPPSVHSLWAKTKEVQSLCEHMRRSAEKARDIWRHWLPAGARACFSCSLGASFAEALYVFLAYVHDIGKATPAFQLAPRIPEELREAVEGAGFPSADLSINVRKEARHALASHAILLGKGLDISLAVIVGGHHGKPPSDQQNRDVMGAERMLKRAFGLRAPAWRAAQDALFEQALAYAKITQEELCAVRLTISQQMLLTGLVILADWLASSQDDIVLPERWETRGEWELYGMPVFAEHIGYPLNNMQSAAVEAGLGMGGSGIVVIEAAMGTGKTEAALALAEIFAYTTGRSGVYFALPTRATADGILQRFRNWIGRAGGGEPHAIMLAHGKARFNELYRDLPRAQIGFELEGKSDDVYVHEWFSGRKTQLLADFAVGTIDQLLMCALRHKHLALRHVGFANKVVIIDEVHAYDAYMNSYLEVALRWLGEYGVPVVVLSATLPSDTRRRLVEAYLGKSHMDSPADWISSRAYPLMTYTDGDRIRQTTVQDNKKRPLTVSIERFDGDIGDKLEALLEGGGCAGIIVNTVRRAQELARVLEERFGEDMVLLLHARYMAADRARREKDLLEKLGPPPKEGECEKPGQPLAAVRPDRLIVVGTQVVEQSLDIDFDIMLSECCPMDLLLQRMGRLHRHERKRPAALSQAMCFVMNVDTPDAGSVTVYGEYALLCTRFLLPDRIELPGDIPLLVQAAYGSDVPVPEGMEDAFEEARTAHQKEIDEKKKHAGAFRLEVPSERTSSNLVGALEYRDAKATDRQGEASVRDGDQALEVILLARDREGYRLLPWIHDGARITHEETPEPGIAYALAGCSVGLPPSLTKRYALEHTIKELEERRKSEIPACWDDSHWLRGALYLPMDERGEAKLCGHTLRYTEKLGLESVRTSAE